MSMTACDTPVSLSHPSTAMDGGEKRVSRRARLSLAEQRDAKVSLSLFSRDVDVDDDDTRVEKRETHARRAKGNPVPIPEPGSGTAYNSGPRKSVRRGNPK